MPKSVTFDREEVIEKVMDLFWVKGYNGTSMQDLVDVTGLNRSSFYNTFGDKFSLFEESIKHYQTKQDTLLQQNFTTAHSPRQAIVSLFRSIGKDISSGNQKGCMITSCTTELSNDPKVKNFLIENKSRVVGSFAKLITEAQKKGEISDAKNAETLALFLFSSLQGLRITSMLDADLEAVTEEILSVL